MANSNNSNNIGADFKRKRNFTEEEKNFLVELVQQHQQIITSKDNKSSMKLIKDKVWSEIHQQFNDNNMRSFNNSTRTLDQLKKCWVSKAASLGFELCDDLWRGFFRLLFQLLISFLLEYPGKPANQSET